MFDAAAAKYSRMAPGGPRWEWVERKDCRLLKMTRHAPRSDDSFVLIRRHMPLLFALAGTSTYFALKKRSGSEYSLERLKRLLLAPLHLEHGDVVVRTKHGRPPVTGTIA